MPKPQTQTYARPCKDLGPADSLFPEHKRRVPILTSNFSILFFETAGTTSETSAINKRQKLGEIWTCFKKECPDLVSSAQKAVRELRTNDDRGWETIKKIIALVKNEKNGERSVEADALTKQEARVRKPFETACRIALSACYYELLDRGADKTTLIE